MPEETDAKIDTSSSVTDVTASSSLETADKANVPEQVAKEPTLESVAQKAYADSLAREKQPEPTAEEEAADGAGLSSTKTDKEAAKPEDAAATDTEGADKGPIPYERFREINETKKQFEEKVKEYEPMVQAHRSIVDYCQQHQISEDQFRQGMDLMRLVNTDPVAAKAALEPVWNQLSGLTGDTLPEDLAQEVADGTLSATRAKELAKFRGLSKVSSAKQQITTQDYQKQQQQQFATALGTSLKSWSDSKATIDPGFKPKAGQNGTDGKYEYVTDRFYRLMAATPPKSIPDAIKLIEQAYADVSKTFSSLTPKAALQSKSISSTKSSPNTAKPPTSAMEAVQQMLASKRA